MIRLSKLADYAIVLLAYVARPAINNATCSAKQLAELSTLPLPTVRKVLKMLTRAGVLKSQRGQHGGYSLAHPATDLSVAAIVKIMEGPVAMTECSGENACSCDIEPICPVRDNWSVLSQAVRQALDGVTLADMITKLPPTSPSSSRLKLVDVPQA